MNDKTKLVVVSFYEVLTYPRFHNVYVSIADI